MMNPPKFENEKMVGFPSKACDIITDVSQLNYAKGSPERAELTQAIQKLKSGFPFTIPININGSEVRIPYARGHDSI